MDGMMSVVSYGVGTVIGLIALSGLIILIVYDVTQKKHTVLPNFPVIGRSANHSIALNMLYPCSVVGVQPTPLPIQGSPAAETRQVTEGLKTP